MLIPQTQEPPKVLLIDDSNHELSALVEMMNGRNLRVYVAFDGKDGFHKALLIKPALILLDIEMPKLNGLVTCRWLKESPETKDIPIIFLSSHNDPEKRIECLKMGAVDFVTKPFHAEEVITRVQIHLILSQKTQTINRTNNSTMQTAEHSNASRTMEYRLINTLSRNDTMLVNAAMNYLRQHIDQNLSGDELAKHLGCNTKRLNLAFKEGTGMTMFGWLRQERLKQATEWLLHTETPILQIAESLGYSSQANFAKAFREHFGCSASAFRQNEKLTKSADN